MSDCPYCGQPTEKRDSAIVYGRSYGLILICTDYPRCDAFVGCHKGTGEPKGTLARGPLRALRKAAHAAFDPRWQSGRVQRRAAYKWLAEATGIPDEDCHIGMMDEARCRAVIAACAADR